MAGTPPPSALTSISLADLNATVFRLVSAQLAAAGVTVNGSVTGSIIDGGAISAGDTAWMITATAFTLLMTIPGKIFFY